jgi:glycosyltransferase involved in cell wall biosynthesis
MIGKYPPIEGGESSKLYWLVKALGEKGNEVHIATNAWEVETKYREEIKGEDLDGFYQPKGVYVHNTDPFIEPTFIPYFKPYTEKIASKAIEVIKEYDLQLIDSWYILPYVISGFLAKRITGLPQIMRHAGSDVTRLLNSPSLRTLFISVFKEVDKIVTHLSLLPMFKSLGVPEEKLFLNLKVSVNINEFTPTGPVFDLSEYVNRDVDDLPVITYLGKLSATKGVYELAEAANGIKAEFILLFVTQNTGLEHFQGFIKELGLEKKTIFVGFVPPWKVPSVIRRSTCVVCPERDFPIPQHTPILPREVLACGRCLILSTELYEKFRRRGFKDKENCLVVNPKDILGFRETIELVLNNVELREEIASNARSLSEKIEHFEEYVNETIALYEEIINTN